MKKKALYRLPGPGRLERRARLLRTVALAALGWVGLAYALTQHLAWRLGYDEALGEPWVELSASQAPGLLLVAAGVAVAAVALLLRPGRRRLALPLLALVGLLGVLAVAPLYTPAHLFLWAWQGRGVPELAALFAGPLRLLALAGIVCTFLIVVDLARLSVGTFHRPDTHGSAHWASAEDVRASDLLGDKGLLLGLWRERGRLRYLRHDGPEHVFVFAPTRTGKGVGLVVPNLLTWPGSVLVHDLKGENWALSAGWREKELGSRCLRFDPTDAEGRSARYNPLAEVRLGAHEVRDAQSVADILVDPNGDRLRDHWDRTAHALLVGVILHVLYREPDKTLRGCASLLSRPDRKIDATLKEMLETEHDPEGQQGWIDPGTSQPTKVHPVVAAAARALLDKADNERSGVLSTALSFLDLYRDPVLAKNTAESDFALTDLMQAEVPVSLYLTVPASDLSRTRPLVRILLNQVLRRLTEELEFEDGHPVPHYRHRLLLMLDEFPALGRLAFFQESLAYLAGYGIRAMLITQDLAQHYGVYGPNEAITGNCHIRIAFTANKPETAELLSRMAGEMTVHQESRTVRGGRFELVPGQQTLGLQQTKRRLLTADEAMRLPPEDALVFVAGSAPIRAGKIRYYVDAELRRRSAC